MRQPHELDDVTILLTWGESETCVEAAAALELDPRALERHLVDRRRMGLKIPVKPFGVVVEPAASAKPARPYLKVPLGEFARAWQAATSAQQVADHFGTTTSLVCARASWCRRRGLRLKKFPTGNKTSGQEHRRRQAIEIAALNREFGLEVPIDA